MYSKKVSFYNGNIYDSTCAGYVSLEYWAEAQRDPKPEVLKTLNEVAAAGKAGDHKLKQELKSKLFYITPSVMIPKGMKRRYSSISYFTGYAQIDIDKLDSIAEAKELRDYLFDQYTCLVMSYLSPSKLGVKCIIKIPRCTDVEEYKDYYAAIEEEFRNHSDNFDHAPTNCVLPLFISHDVEIRYRDDAETWIHKNNREVDYVHLNKVESEWGRERSDDQKSLYTIEQFKNKIDEIVDSNGHPRFRSACLVLGSRAGADYIDVQHAIELMEWACSSNPYLVKKRTTYLKTGYWCINQGYGNPSYY